jgi:hypothetical protein
MNFTAAQNLIQLNGGENKENEYSSNERHEEYQYLDQIRHVIKTGKVKGDRTGVGVKSVFGHYSRYSLRNSKNYSINCYFYL